VTEPRGVRDRGLRVTEVAEGGPAARAGIRAGDFLLTANGIPLRDVIDLRYHAAEPWCRLGLQRGGEELHVQVAREYGEDLGLAFESELADGVRTCDNKCVFCFIHQLPKGLRRSLYVLDDDYRLSFLHGNYVTLTNLAEGDMERIREQALSPLYVSVHATDQELRGRMLGLSRPSSILPILGELARHGIEVHAQVVVCPGWNDGPALERTVRELAALHPRVSGLGGGVVSLAPVPVGLTRFRARLPHITPVDGPYARGLLDACETWRAEFRGRLDTAFVFPSDEWFFYAGREVPPREWYEQFPQFENGVGTSRAFLDDTEKACCDLAPPTEPLCASILTAPMAEGPVGQLVARLNALPGVDLNVCVVQNDFLGSTITVAGLMTGQDLIARMGRPDVRHHVLIPAVCANEDGLLLDDVPAAELGARSGKRVEVVEPTPRALADALRIR
jgi:putative radical SAM enzyme (TIGR03279 family)